MRFEEMTVGRMIRGGTRDVSEQEIIEFARRYDPQPFHIDPVRAAASRWGGLIASGWMTCGIAMELVAREILEGSDSLGSPGVEQIEWPAPVRPGDRLRLTVTVVESRISSSGTIGIVKWRWELHNQADGLVLRLLGTSFFEVGPSDG
ncbi:MAG: MaoC family dehydratase [Gemmatimonadota bacterium]